METNTDTEKHRVFYKRPKKVPPFDTAFVKSSDIDGLKLLLAAAPEYCQIVLYSSGERLSRAMRYLFRRKFRLNSQALQLDLRTLELNGVITYQFVRGDAQVQPLSHYFCLGDSCLHELSRSPSNQDVIDMFCCGILLHTALKDRGLGRSLVFLEE